MRAANWSRRLGTIPQRVVDTSLVALLPLLALVTFLIGTPTNLAAAARRLPGGGLGDPADARPGALADALASAWRSARWRYVTEPSRLTDDAGTPGA